VLQSDVVDVLRANPTGFDAIMLDTDNGPDGMLMSENARLYATRGIEITVSALRTGGSIVYWSVGDDPKFAHALRRSGLTVRALHIRAHDTAGPMHTLYVATPRGR
jgi:spermidine synthase